MVTLPRGFVCQSEKATARAEFYPGDPGNCHLQPVKTSWVAVQLPAWREHLPEVSQVESGGPSSSLAGRSTDEPTGTRSGNSDMKNRVSTAQQEE